MVNLIIHNSLFPSPYPYPTQVVLKYYPSICKPFGLGYTLGRPWLHLGYTLGRPWVGYGHQGNRCEYDVQYDTRANSASRIQRQWQVKSSTHYLMIDTL